MPDKQADNPPPFPSFEELKSLPDSEDPYVFSVALPDIQGRYRLLKLGSMAVSDGNMELQGEMARHTGLKHFNDLPLVEMNFVMEGTLRQKLGYLPEELIFSKGYHNVMYNLGEWEHNRFLGDGIHNTCTINIHADRFVQLFSAYDRQLEQMSEKIMRGEPFMFQQPALPFTPQIHATINAIWGCPLSGGLKSLYLETKTMDLMLQQWELFTQPLPSGSVLKQKGDMEKIRLAKELLLQDLCNPPSLAQLARHCGLNEFKLKKGFREVFNDTVFGYFNAVRLEHARRLVLDTDKSMSEIAFEAGYAHPQHFSRAFKTKFGVAPGALKSSYRNRLR